MDGLRGLAVLMVLQSHGRFSEGWPRMDWFPMDGSPAVSFFFITSGLLITTLLLDEEERTGRIDYGAFLTRRSLRIFPAYYAFLALMGMLGLLHAIPMTPGGFMASALHVRNLFTGANFWTLSHTWSLSLQEQFYLLWPLALQRFPRRVLAPLCVAVVAAWPLIRLVRHGHLAPLDGHLALDAPGMETVLYGALLALAIRSNRLAKPLQFLARGYWGFVLPVASIWAIYACVQQWPSALNVLLSPTRNLAVVWLVWWCVNNADTWVGRLLEGRVLLFLGELSFSLYLWQQPFLGFNRAWICAFPQNLVLAFAAALASHYLIERPVLQWRKARLVRKAAAPAVGDVAVAEAGR